MLTSEMVVTPVGLEGIGDADGAGINICGDAGLPEIGGAELPAFEREIGEEAIAISEERKIPDAGDDDAVRDVVVRRRAFKEEGVYVLLDARIEGFLIGIRG